LEDNGDGEMDWFIEIDTLDELLAVCQAAGADASYEIVVNGIRWPGDMPGIEIYDYYRE
jgi:hypothetical protein